MDNHSAHISKETRAYLATRPNRFICVPTPRDGSWLNLVETLFGKMARTFLKHIRVQSVKELKDRTFVVSRRETQLRLHTVEFGKNYIEGKGVIEYRIRFSNLIGSWEG